jgi:AcrR family transcriptional regulator
MVPVSGPSGVRRPGGRTARVRAAVLDAADRLVLDGRESVTVRGLAEGSGVSEPTIYRRWRTAENVLVDAAVRHLSQASPVLVTGDLRADLVTWAEEVERSIATAAGARFLAVLIRARVEGTNGPTDSGGPSMDERIDQLRALLETDGAPAALTVDRLLDDVLAPLYVRELLGYGAQRSAAQLVGECLAGIGSGDSAAH